MKNIYNLLVAITALFFSIQAHADYVVIVNPDNYATISNADIENLYLAKTKTFPDGSLAIPLNQDEALPIRSAFDNNVVGKTDSQMKSYWAKLVFTGKAVPIKQLASDQEILELVAKNPSTIGYIDASSVDSSVKVVSQF